MADAFKVSCLQFCAGADTDENLAMIKALMGEAVGEGAHLVCLPEYAACYGMSKGRLEVGAEPEAHHPGLAALRSMARQHDCWLLIGSIGVRRDDGMINNRSYLIDNKGDVRARYDKIHLFDVDLDGGESYRESASIKPGDRAVLVDTPFGRLGLTICYDLRFPQLYRTLAKAGAEMIFIPAAFTRKTGEAHWHTMVTSRAIETGAYIVAPCQCGDANGTLARYGHSLIVGPWGEVLADGKENVGIVTAELDLAHVEAVRRKIPALTHDRLVEVELVTAGDGNVKQPSSHPSAS
ncbi:MAG: carbon-nitrogen hydrolase family protein [Geminicoccaceae bacterium]